MVQNNIEVLRNKMGEKGIDGILVPTADPHQSEYIPDHYKTREFITHFSGSNGVAVITQEDAYIWTDGRYFIQCAREIQDTSFMMKKLNTPGEMSVVEYLSSLPDDSIIEVNYELFSNEEFDEYQRELDKKNIRLVDGSTLESIWEQRPALPKESGFILDVKYAGKSRDEKFAQVREILQENEADATFISSLDDIAWVLNIRGNDIEHTPVLISYLLLSQNGGIFFVDQSKISDEIRDSLEEDGIHIVDYDRVFRELENINGLSIYVDPSRTSKKVYDLLANHNEMIKGQEITKNLKARKNSVEIENLREAYLQDGIALTKFIYWVKHHSKELSEYEAGEALVRLRENRPNYIDESFDPIVAYGENAAMMHYSAKKGKDVTLANKGFLLVDSGGQYLNGTTDTTRTIGVGKLSKDEIHDYTLVLKGYIDLLRVKFMKGTTDKNIDILARFPLWQEGKDYKSGTGHGVGYLLGVHESPPRIAFQSKEATVLTLGHVVTVEPGYYLEGKYGIRIENTAVVEEYVENEEGVFYQFDTFQRVPLERDAIDVGLLSSEQIEWVNEYHEKVYADLSDHLTDDEREWLREVTLPIDYE